MTATHAQPVILRRSLGDRLLVVFFGCITLVGFVIVAVVTVAAVNYSIGLALFMVIPSAILAACVVVIFREASSRWRTRIVVSDRQVRLELPTRRGYVAMPAVAADLPLPEIKGVETRGEAFRSLGNTVLQRSYVLVRPDGSRLFLGGDRPWVPPFFGPAAAAIASRVGLTIVDRGTVQGQPGMILVWGLSVPPWEAPPLAAADASRLEQQASRSLYWVWIIVSGALLIGALARLLG